MLRNGSPAGENTESRGLPAGVVPLNIHRHRIEDGPTRSDKSRPQRWEVFDSTTRPTLVRELEVEESAPAPEAEPEPAPAPVVEVEPEPEPVPEREREPEPAPEVEAEPESAPAPEAEPEALRVYIPKSDGKVWPKMLYAEALAAGCPDLTDAEYRLLMAMWKYADNRTLRGVRPGHAALAEQVGLSGKSGRDKVRTRISSLLRKGYLVRTREGRSTPTKVTAEYRLTLPKREVGEA